MKSQFTINDKQIHVSQSTISNWNQRFVVSGWRSPTAGSEPPIESEFPVTKEILVQCGTDDDHERLWGQSWWPSWWWKGWRRWFFVFYFVDHRLVGHWRKLCKLLGKNSKHVLDMNQKMNTLKVTRSGLRQTGRIWYFSPEKFKNLNDLYVMKNESMDFDKFAYFVFAFKLIWQCE